jgi:hypothetical protein
LRRGLEAVHGHQCLELGGYFDDVRLLIGAHFLAGGGQAVFPPVSFGQMRFEDERVAKEGLVIAHLRFGHGMV